MDRQEQQHARNAEQPHDEGVEKAQLQRDAETAAEKYSLMQSDLADAAERMKKLKSVIDLRVGALRIRIDDIPDGAAILAFYKTISDELSALINALAMLG